MLIPIDKKTLQANVNSAYFQRGVRYYNQGRVLQLKQDKDKILHGRVSGSGQSYAQQVSFQQFDGKWYFYGDCSCPVGENCKHVVALLLEAIKRAENEADIAKKRKAARPRLQRKNPYKEQYKEQHKSLDLWKKQLTSALLDSNPIETPLDTSETGIVYSLDISQQDNKVQVNAFKTRRLLKGGYSNLTPLSMREIKGDYYPPEYVTKLDLQIAKRLMNDRQQWGNYQIEGEDGAIVLRQLLQTNRCYYGDITRTTEQATLQQGEPASAQFIWIEHDNGDKTLQVTMENRAPCHILSTLPPFYLDSSNNLCGEIDHPLNNTLFLQLLNLPTLEPSEQPQISMLLMQMQIEETVPPPIELQQVQIDEPVRAQLTLSRLQHEVNTPHSACLELNYNGVVLSGTELRAEDQTTLLRDNIVYQIQRDLSGEQRVLQRLADFGFSPCGEEEDEQLELVIPADSRQESAYLWRDFIATLPELEAEGWLINTEASFQMRFEQVEEIQAQVKNDGNDWFEVGMSIKIGPRKVDLLPLITQWLEEVKDPNSTTPIIIEHRPSEWVEIAAELIRPIAQTLFELFDHKGATLRLPVQNASRLHKLEQLLAEKLRWSGGKKLRQLGEKLQNFDGIKTVPVPKGLQAELRPYQQLGLNWLGFLREYGFGGILADDMGLGKTVQTLALLLKEKEARRMKKPSLIVAPTSLLGNWRFEAQRFTPKLKVLIYHGAGRKPLLEEFGDYDLIITNYPLLARDTELLMAASDYHYLVLDEAQTIKNPKSQAAKAARLLTVKHRLCLTGTPMENHLGELWALYDFLMPGFMGDIKQFIKLFRTPIEKQGNNERRQQLVERISPFMLRRTKQEVAPELPPKSEILRMVEMEPDQRRLYETIRVAMAERVQQLLSNKGLRRSRIEMLDALLKLRQVCCDPQLVKLPSARKVKHSAKLEMLMTMLPEMLEEGRRILIFSQFTSMLSLIETRLNKAQIDYTKLTGQTRKRQQAIDAFQNGEVPVFLISIKAGGTGLNLTAADTVIHYDPWWNPAVENQATDRAYRIGQEKPVFVYKLICEESVEEKVLELQKKKQRLADGIYGKVEGEESKTLTADELLDLFSN